MTLSPDLLGLCTNPKIDPDAAKPFRPIYRIRIGNTVLSNAFSPVFPIFLVHNTALTPLLLFTITWHSVCRRV